MIQPFKDLFNVFFPNLCAACNSKLNPTEEILCIHCERMLPYSDNYAQYESDIYRKLCGKIPVEGAASFLIFEHHSPVRKLIHNLKYKGQTEIGEYLGNKIGNLLATDNSVIKNVDIVLPLPLHPKKLKLRGFNQCDLFAKTIAEKLNADYNSSLLTRSVLNDSQTKKTKHKRFSNVDKIFSVNDEYALESKHILLVDDVVTTGATAESCMATLLEVKNTKVSFVAMAEVKSK